MTDAPKDTRDAVKVFFENLEGADRVVIETRNALGEMDAHYMHAPAILEARNTRTDHFHALIAAAYEAAARAQEAAFRKGVFIEKHSDHIRALTPADAKTAYDKAIAAAERRGMERAAEIALSVASARPFYRLTCQNAAFAIRAAMEDKKP